MSSNEILLVISFLAAAVAAVSAVFAYRQSKAATIDVHLTQQDLSLTAYSNAVQGLLDLKKSFAENPGIFLEQIRAGDIEDAIPASMRDNPATFLLFAGGMWKFSYVYSIMSRWKELGLTEREQEGLKAEIKLWMTGLPGFYEVYQAHTNVFRAHNEDFLDFLNRVVYTEDFVQQRQTTADGEAVGQSRDLAD